MYKNSKPRLEVACACGCGELFINVDDHNRYRKYKLGHATRKRTYPKGHFDYMKGNTHGFPKGNTPWNKGLIWTEKMGEKNPAWRGGTSFNRGSRWHTNYKRWRKKIFERDGFTCQICGIVNPKPIHADHIKSWNDHPDLRFELSNGRTLCWPCHKKTDTYGYRSKVVD